MLTLTSRDNTNIKNTVKLKNSSKFRRKAGLFIAEGVRVCYDALLSGAQIETVFVTQDALDKYPEKTAQLCEKSAKSFTVTDDIFSHISDTQSPQGVLCVIKTLDKVTEFDTIKDGGKFLALENIQDPNNLGTVLRSAEAFGVSGVIMSADCCDIYNPKVVRGSMGAVFRLPFIIAESIPEFLSENPVLTSYAAVVDSDAEKITEISFDDCSVTVIGNEGNGLTKETVSACDHKITIPMRGKAESLNASTAASIIIWEMIK